MASLLRHGLLRQGRALCNSNRATLGVVAAPLQWQMEAKQWTTTPTIITRREAHTIEVNDEEFSNAAQVVNRLNRHLISAGIVNKLQEKKYYEKKHQKRRRLKNQQIRNVKLRKVQAMADWAEYLRAKGIPLPLKQNRIKWA